MSDPRQATYSLRGLSKITHIKQSANIKIQLGDFIRRLTKYIFLTCLNYLEINKILMHLD